MFGMLCKALRAGLDKHYTNFNYYNYYKNSRQFRCMNKPL